MKLIGRNRPFYRDSQRVGDTYSYETLHGLWQEG